MLISNASSPEKLTRNSCTGKPPSSAFRTDMNGNASLPRSTLQPIFSSTLRLFGPTRRIRKILRALQELQRRKITILLVEQNVNATLEITDRAYVLEQGSIAMEGLSSEMKANEHVRNAYLGV